MDEQTFSIITPYSRHPTNQNSMDNHQQSLCSHILQCTPRQYSTLPEFQDTYGSEPPSSILQNTSRYTDTSRTIKEEHDINSYLYSPPSDFGGEMNLNVHHPTHTERNTIRYPPSHSLYSSDLNSPTTGGLAMPLRIASSRLDSAEAHLVPAQTETPSSDFHYPMRALQPQHHPQQRQHDSLPHHQHQNHALNCMQGNSAFFSPSITYSPLDQEHSSPGEGLDRQPQTQLSSLEYDSTEPHPQHLSVPAMVYDPLPHDPMVVPGQGVRHDATLNHCGTNSSSPGCGSYHASISPASSIPMSNNKHNRGTSSSMNISMPGTHTSSSFRVGPSSRWTGHPSSFDIAGSTPGATSAHGQVPVLSSTPASASVSSSLRPILSHSDSDSRSSPENSFTQDNSRLRASQSAQTLSSSHSTHSHTNSPSPRLSDNESTIGGRSFGRELFCTDDRESDQNVGANETAVQMSEKSSSAEKDVIRTGEEVGERSLAPAKKKKKSKMHCCGVCAKKFPRPSGLRTHMNTHNNEKPFPCGFPGCMRSFGVRSNAKRHLRTHGIIPAPAVNPNSADAPYIVGFCPPVIAVPHSSSNPQSQSPSVEGGDDFRSLGIRLVGDNASIQIRSHGQSDVQLDMNPVPLLKLKWMPPSLTTRTNAESLREVKDEQQVHWAEDIYEAM